MITPEYEILLIEDDPMVSLAMRYTLESAGFLVRAVGDGASGLAEWRKQAPDIIVTDLMLPERDGMEVIHEIRGSGSNIPILAISGLGPEFGTVFLKAANREGADLTLQKPVRAQQLIASINRLLVGSTPSGQLAATQQAPAAKPQPDAPASLRY